MADLIDNAIYAHLAGDANVASMVADRIYPADLPQEYLLPALVYTRISFVQQPTQTSRGLPNPRYQLDSYGEAHDDADLLAQYVSEALHCFAGQIVTGGKTYTIRAAFVEGWQGPQRQPMAANPDNPDPGIYRAIQDFIIWHLEVV